MVRVLEMEMDMLKSLNAGDRVRVTFEAEVLGHDIDGDVYVMANGGLARTIVRHGVASAPGFKLEVIEKPIAVGDVVFDPLAGSSATVIGEIVTGGNRHLWLDGGPSGFRTRHESSVSRIK